MRAQNRLDFSKLLDVYRKADVQDLHLAFVEIEDFMDLLIDRARQAETERIISKIADFIRSSR